MHRVLVVASLLVAGVASAKEPGVVVGAQAGVSGWDALDLPDVSWRVVPRVGYWFDSNYGVELDVGYSMGSTEISGHDYFSVNPMISFVGLPLPSSKDSFIQPLVRLGAGVMYKNVDADGVRGDDVAGPRTEGAVQFGMGLRFPVTDWVAFRVEATAQLSVARETDVYINPFLNYYADAGVEFRFGTKADADRDGVGDDMDRCVDVPEDIDGFEDGDGCPDTDNDGDAVLDSEDTCPMKAEDVDGFEDTDGCPDFDNDGDGLADADDVCPDAAGTEATKGCPDGDADGLADADDRCPTEAGSSDLMGCPDADTDGVADIDDECPTEAGEASAFGCTDGDADRVPDHRDECDGAAAPADVDAKWSNGCDVPVYRTAAGIMVNGGVAMTRSGTSVTSTGKKSLSKVAALINEIPAGAVIVVEGHTDASGDKDAQLARSEARAKAVYDYLIAQGIPAERLQVKAMGATQPAGDSASANNRVAFTVLVTEETAAN